MFGVARIKAKRTTRKGTIFFMVFSSSNLYIFKLGIYKKVSCFIRHVNTNSIKAISLRFLTAPLSPLRAGFGMTLCAGLLRYGVCSKRSQGAPAIKRISGVIGKTMRIHVYRHIGVWHFILYVLNNIFSEVVGFNEAQCMVHYEVKFYKPLRT